MIPYMELSYLQLSNQFLFFFITNTGEFQGPIVSSTCQASNFFFSSSSTACNFS